MMNLNTIRNGAMSRKICLVLLSIMICFSTTFTFVFASDKVISKEYIRDDFSTKINLGIDNDTVSAGKQFKITLSLENILNADKTQFEVLGWDYSKASERTAYKKVLVGQPTVSYSEENMILTGMTDRKCVLKKSDSSNINLTDVKATLTFTVKDDAAPTELKFTNTILVNSSVSTDSISFDPITITITDTPTPDPTPTEATYTVSTKPSADSVYAGDKFNVDVVASADQATDLASLEAILQYDKELVKPIGAKATAINTEATPLFYTDGSNGVTTDGTGKVYLYGKSEQTGTDGLVVATYEFEALKPGSASFSIADGAGIGRSGKPDFDIKATTGAASTVEIKAIPDEKYLISNADYKGAPDGKQVLKYVAKDMPADGNAYFYGEDASPLYYAYDDNDGKHVFLGFVDAALTNDTLAAVTEKAGKYETLSYTGDINRNGSINAVDSLIAYDLATGVYSVDSDMSILTAQRRLEADINNDGKVTAADARAIMFKALGIDDPELAQ